MPPEVNMPRRGKKMTYEERLACTKQMAAGKTDVQIAQANGWSIWTVRKWRRIYQKQGETALAPVMGRPKKGALSTYAFGVCDQIESMRRGHMGWGPITLLEEITALPAYFGVGLPSRARVAAFLKEKHLVRHYERHSSLPEPPSEPVLQAHDEWEMDAQGGQDVAGLGKVSVVNLVDVVSRLKVESYPHLWDLGLSWLDYQLILRCAFVQYGLPKGVTLDHDSAFFDNTSHSPYPSRLHLWLVGLGVGVVFITKPPPAQHAIVERGHQTMTAQAITGQTWKSQKALWKGLDQRRDFLNTLYPSRSLQYQSPLGAFPTAIHSQRDYRPEWEAELFDLKRVYDFLTQGRWFRETSLHGEFWLGMQRYNSGRACAHTTQELTFDRTSLEFTAKTAGTDRMHRFAAKGLTKNDLMGELAPFTRLPSYQLVLPFTQETWRQNRLAQLVRGTTL
jgi:transposase